VFILLNISIIILLLLLAESAWFINDMILNINVLLGLNSIFLKNNLILLKFYDYDINYFNDLKCFCLN